MEKPRVIVSSCASVDGRITLSADTLLLYGDRRWSEVAGGSEGVYRRIMHAHQPQALLEGSGSFVREGDVPSALETADGDDPALQGDYLPESVVKMPGRKWLAVVDGRGRVRWAFKEYPGEEWQGWHILVLVSSGTPAEYLAYLRRERIPYIVAGTGPVDLARALEKMRALLGITCLVSTAGGRLNGALLRAGLVDEFEVTFFPALIGGRGTPALFDAPPLAADETPQKLTLMEHSIDADGFVHLRYALVKERNA